jgi:hypothetical protein
VDTLLKEKNETRDGVLLVSPIQNMETYLQFVQEPGFQVFKDVLLFNKYFLYCQVGVGEDGGIHQSTC